MTHPAPYPLSPVPSADAIAKLEELERMLPSTCNTTTHWDDGELEAIYKQLEQAIALVYQSIDIY